MEYIIIMYCKWETGLDISTRQLAMASENFIWRVRPESHSPKCREWNLGGNILASTKSKLLAKFKYALNYLYQSYLFQISFIYINIDENFARAYGARSISINMATLYQHIYFTILKLWQTDSKYKNKMLEKQKLFSSSHDIR